MIVDERIVDYIIHWKRETVIYCETIEQEALKERVPIIRKEMQRAFKSASAF